MRINALGMPEDHVTKKSGHEGASNTDAALTETDLSQEVK